MSNQTESTLEQPVPAPARSKNVVMGSQSFINVLGRSIAAELYKIRRRAMSKVLSTIAVVTVILALLFTNSTSSRLLPEVLNTIISVTNFIGTILFIILAGTIVGGEYSVGSIRLMLTRGPTRIQFLLAKLGAILACICIAYISLVVIGIITWMLLNLPTGRTIDLSVVNGIWLLHTVLYFLVTLLSVFTYCLLAISLSTWGKATAAGVTGVLIWWFLEGGISGLFSILGNRMQNAFGSFLAAIPDYFIGNNLGALRTNQQNYILGGAAGSIDDIHAGIVIIVYLLVFGGITWWALKARDITS
ncbi:ABC transporter permease [Dictyobacter kobayashii]|uniref:ABC transporter permease n=1 Tax=Dictyobacter kobayashii TaxID=2014872 RepID=A0A402AFM8_9CHLR|nr:ABC transporter permease [Dictyobacter kobayashii]GCE17911.1 hypothetical protein KDK_17110 [Dictyobacter kobayashii]